MGGLDNPTVLVAVRGVEQLHTRGADPEDGLIKQQRSIKEFLPPTVIKSA